MIEHASDPLHPASRPGLPSPAELGIEDWLINAVLWLKLAVEAAGALVIGIGVAVAISQFARRLWTSGTRDYNPIRLTLARHLALALELQLGADILGTAVAPSWDQIGKLAAIAIIRTALNYFLMREIREEYRDQGDRPKPPPQG